MKKRKILNICLFSIALFFSFIALTSAEGCILGAETTKDVKGALRIFQIIAPIALLGFTIIDAIKAVNSGGSFHFADGGDMPTQKLVSRFVKRMIGVLLLFILPTLINWLFIFIGIWGKGEGCDLTDKTTTPSDPSGCYSIAGGYTWGKQSEYESVGMRVENEKCGRNEHGAKYECYQCNSNSSVKKWKATSDADSDCSSAYHIIGGYQSDCK